MIGGVGGKEVAAGASHTHAHHPRPLSDSCVVSLLSSSLSPTTRSPPPSLPGPNPLTPHPQKHFRPKLPEDSKKKGKARKTKVEWTVRETRDLLDGVKKHGKGSWTKIIDDNEYSFHRGRITNDLSNVGC